MTQRDHTILALIAVLVGLYLLRLSSVEIQPWDEGLYAVRGESIILFDEWWDQTPHALGGLYSSTPPPLPSWSVAAGVSLLGHTAAGVRLLTILMSGIALWLFYGIARSMVSQQGTLVAVLMLGTSLPWVMYSRQAMSEVPLMMFTLLGLWASIRDDHYRWFGVVAIAGALLTKLTVGLLPALFFLPQLRDRERRWTTLAIIAGGLVVALPWYATMLSRYGDDFWLAMSIPHLTTAIEGNAGSWGPLYYLNQLVISHPLLIAAVVYVIAAVIHRASLPHGDRRAAVLSVFWFVAIMLVLSAAATKNPHYVVMLLPPAVLTACYGYERLSFTDHGGRWMILLYGSVLLALLWNIDVVRTSMKSATHGLQGVGLLGAVGIAVIIGVTGITLLASARWRRSVVIHGYKAIVVLGLMVGGGQAISDVMQGPERMIQGGRSTAQVLLDQSAGSGSFTYLYHQHTAGDAMNPQLAWYLGGWMNGWLPSYRYTPAALPADTVDFNVLVYALALPHQWIVYYHPGIPTDVQKRDVEDVLAVLFRVEQHSGHYTLFRRR